MKHWAQKPEGPLSGGEGKEATLGKVGSGGEGQELGWDLGPRKPTGLTQDQGRGWHGAHYCVCGGTVRSCECRFQGVHLRSGNTRKNGTWEPQASNGQSAPPGLRLSADQRALVYSALGLCLGAILCCFLLAMVCFLKRRGDLASRQCPPGLCPTPAASSQDPGMEAGPKEPEQELEQEQERVEACSFCFPQCRAPAQERGGAPGSPGPMPAGRCGHLVPTMAEPPYSGSPDSSLQAVCSPTQEGGLAV